MRRNLDFHLQQIRFGIIRFGSVRIPKLRYSVFRYFTRFGRSLFEFVGYLHKFFDWEYRINQFKYIICRSQTDRNYFIYFIIFLKDKKVAFNPYKWIMWNEKSSRCNIKKKRFLILFLELTHYYSR